MTHTPEAVFRKAYADTYPDVLRFVQRRVHPTLADDVVAETFLVAWRRVSELPTSTGEARAWLFGVARKCLLNARRSDRRTDALAVRIADATSPSVPTDCDDAEFIARRVDLSRAWTRLSAAEQEVLALTVFDGLTSADAAAVLGVSAVAYRIRLSRARNHLRRLADPASAPTASIDFQEMTS